MLFRATAIALIASVASARSFIPSSDIAADSKLGNKLLSMATVVQDARHLENGDRDVSFIANYKLKYLGCSSITSMNSGEGGGGGQDGESMIYTQNLVRFALCPGSCSSCTNGGEYVVNMETFVDTYTEAKLTEQEYACETVRENCYYDDETTCYTEAGMTECIDYDDGQEEFEIQRYLECAGTLIVAIGCMYCLQNLFCSPC
jgi:hypothetical protein